MAIIAPNTDVYLLQNVPLNEDYENTILFSSATEQFNYFYSKRRYTLSNYTFQRNNGKLRVSVPAESAMMCNYMMYRNTSFGNKWFYAFIKTAHYINNETSEIEFEIDELQTWHFDYTINDVFVERNHVATDTIGWNIAPEPVECGEYILNDFTPLNPFEYCIILATVETTGGSDGNVYDGIYGGATLWLFKNDTAGVQAINTKINDYYQAPESIVSIYMAPSWLFGGNANITNGTKLSFGQSGVINTYTGAQLLGTESLGQYVPKNKKLYTYPYNYLNINNGSGTNLVLRYEFFLNLTPVLKEQGCVTQPITITIAPVNYKGVGSAGNEVTNFTEQIALTNFPICSWNIDAWKAWVAQNSIPLGLGTVINGIGGTLQSIINPVGSVMSLAHTVGSVLSQSYRASIAADTLHGNFNNSNGAIAQRRQNFFLSRMSINTENAERIDNYFTMYGYSIGKVRTITGNSDLRDNRPYYTYLKTVGCDLHGNLPSDSMKIINNLYDKGIRWWKYRQGMNVGDYSVNNAPLP